VINLCDFKKHTITIDHLSRVGLFSTTDPLTLVNVMMDLSGVFLLYSDPLIAIWHREAKDGASSADASLHSIHAHASWQPRRCKAGSVPSPSAVAVQTWGGDHRGGRRLDREHQRTFLSQKTTPRQPVLILSKRIVSA
jgi:hypothetical protein